MSGYVHLYLDTGLSYQSFGFGMLGLSGNVVGEVRVRQYLSSGSEEYRDLVGWTRLDNRMMVLALPVDRGALVAGGKTVAEWRFSSVGGGSFASGQRVVLQSPWTTQTQWVPENRVVTVRSNEGADGYRFGFNGQEKVNEIAGVGNHNTAQFWEYDTRLGLRWNTDPVVNPSESPYATFNRNPIWKNDPLGNTANEYDKNGNKISDLGGDKIDFHHQEDGSTKVVDKETGATNTINNGEKLIRGYEQRPASTTWGQLTREFLMQQGPANSMFADFDNSSEGAFGSLHNAFSSYSAPAREMSLSSRLTKDKFSMNYGNANPFVARDGWEQMWGRSDVSWYKLGDKTLFMMTDSKSATSLFYRATGNWERTPLTMMGNTRQTYMWLESNRSIQQKVDFKTNYDHALFMKILEESRRPLPGKI